MLTNEFLSWCETCVRRRARKGWHVRECTDRHGLRSKTAMSYNNPGGVPKTRCALTSRGYLQLIGGGAEAQVEMSNGLNVLMCLSIGFL